MATLERLRAVDAAELRFRLACELRKTGGRLRTAVRPATWKRGHLASVLRVGADRGSHLGRAGEALRRGDWRSAHLDLAAHFGSRPPRFPIDPRSLPRLTTEILERFPDARAAALARAGRMLEGRYDVLGYTDVPFGRVPDWQSDPVHARKPPFTFWSRVPYLDPQYGDHKVIWEINRHQHWLALARAYHFTADRQYYEAFVAQIEDWMETNPPLQGVNWASMLELAFRTLSWLWALHLFAPAALADPPGAAPWIVDLLLGIDRQLTHIEQNLSQYFSPNTHLSGEALALYVCGSALPELASSARHAALGRRVLLQEIDRQINADGGHAELSAHYHRYSTDFYLLATLVARLCGDEAASRFEEAARRQAKYLRVITDDCGRLPLIGDDDGGQLFPMCGRPAADCRDTLCSAAVILADPTLAAGDAPEETFWLCGTGTATGPAAKPRSEALRASGYYVSRTPLGDHLIFDAGRHGYLNGGHAHADALSIVLTTAGRPFLVDAGTATYTMDPALRDLFRSTAMHNTVVVDGQPQSQPKGPFHWSSRADAKHVVWQSDARCDYMEGIHNGYAPKAHGRAIFALHGIGWVVLDHLVGPAGGSAAAEIFWHMHPDWGQMPGPGGLHFRHPDGPVVSMACTAPLKVLGHEEARGLDSYAPVYGVVQQGLCARAQVAGPLPLTVATFIVASGETGALAIEPVAVTEQPGPGWHGSAFRLSWAGQEAVILAAVERDPEHYGEGAPGTAWGCKLAQTDGRAAFVQLSGPSTPSPILVRGSYAAPPPTTVTVSGDRAETPSN